MTDPGPADDARTSDRGGVIAAKVDGVRGHRRWYALEDRHEALFRGRLLAFAVLAALAAALPGTDPAEQILALGAGTAAIVLHGLLRWVPERWPTRLRLAVDASLLVDAGAIFCLALASGGSDSFALWALLLFAVAVTLGYSAPTGIKATILAAMAALGLQVLDGAETLWTADNGRNLALLVSLVATAATFSSVNERELRQRSERLSTLHESTAAFVGRDDAGELGAAASTAVGRLLPGWDVSVELPAPRAATAEDVERTWREDGKVFLALPVLGVGGDRRPRLLGQVVASRKAPKVGPERVRGQQMLALRTIITNLAGALMQAELVSKLEELSVIDELTGLGNRRAFDTALREEIARAGRNASPMSLIMLDVDHFKAFNDSFGHQAGDVALGLLARVLMQSLRAEDRACRFGGEEFALLLPATDEAQAIEAAERLRHQVAEAPVPHGPITISLGVAATHGGHSGATVVRWADARLYEAKRLGRNRVVGGAAAPARPAALASSS